MKGKELDKQIYKEGESTWGFKYGVLDVEDVKAFIKQLKEELRGDVLMFKKLVDDKIDSLAGDDLK